MNEDLLADLPEELRAGARSLRSEGVYGYAFCISDALKVVELLRDRGLMIIGVDYWTVDGPSRMRPAYEGASFNAGDGESTAERFNRAFEQAVQSIRARALRDPEIWVAFITESEVERVLREHSP